MLGSGTFCRQWDCVYRPSPRRGGKLQPRHGHLPPGLSDSMIQWFRSNAIECQRVWSFLTDLFNFSIDCFTTLTHLLKFTKYKTPFRSNYRVVNSVQFHYFEYSGSTTTSSKNPCLFFQALDRRKLLHVDFQFPRLSGFSPVCSKAGFLCPFSSSSFFLSLFYFPSL